MTSYKDLIAQREELEKQIQEARKKELNDAINRVRGLMAEFALTPEDLFPGKVKRPSTGANKVAPKYRNPSTGETWSGRGKAPKWIQGQDREKFAIA